VIFPSEDEDSNSTVSTSVNETFEAGETESNSTMPPAEDLESIKDDNSTISIANNSATTKPTVLSEANTTEETGNPTANPNPAPFMEQLWKMTEAPSVTTSQDSLEWVDTETNSPSIWLETETGSPSPPPSLQEIDEESTTPTLEPSARPAVEPNVYSSIPPRLVLR
jgi:hypothetical protein